MLVASAPFLFATSSQAATGATITHPRNTTATGLNRRQWKTIVAVQDHLFPSATDSPGAKDINAKAFFYAVLSDGNRDEDDRKLVKSGLISLQNICWNKYKRSFVDLNHEHREIALREIEHTSIGTPWLMTVLGYIFEALLTDPVYGGNPSEIGWQWLDHKPGFPRPTADKRYFLL